MISRRALLHMFAAAYATTPRPAAALADPAHIPAPRPKPRPAELTHAGFGVDWLEGLAGKANYLAPSAIPAQYSHAIYVNTATAGPAAQKMWVLNRQGVEGWALCLSDERYWAKQEGAARYSWPVSTGRHYPGDKRSGPTPVGVFNIDERPGRHRRGWGAPGMYNSVYIDLHYGSGRVSGVAMHGTTASKYRKLGRADSHGCIRMTQANADQLWALFHPAGSHAEEAPLWGEVPRFYEGSAGNIRTGYNREGRLLYDEAGEVLTRPGYRALCIFFAQWG